RLGVGLWVAQTNRLDVLLPIQHFAENGVSVVEVRRRHGSDEKLAAIGSGSGIRHCQPTGAIKVEEAHKLVTKLIAGSATACSGGVAALRHELLNHAVESGVVVIPLLCQKDEAVDGQGGELFK